MSDLSIAAASQYHHYGFTDTPLATPIDRALTKSQADCGCGNCSSCSPTSSKFNTEAAVFEKSEAAGQPDPETAAEIDELKKRDAEVRQHEQAHLMAAGPYAKGGPSYDYKIGPDGKRYAVGGEVAIDTNPIADDPEATIQKARRIKAAALAPAEPSGQDHKVAAQAEQMELKARQELIEKSAETSQTGYGAPATPEPKFVNVFA